VKRSPAPTRSLALRSAWLDGCVSKAIRESARPELQALVDEGLLVLRVDGELWLTAAGREHVNGGRPP